MTHGVTYDPKKHVNYLLQQVILEVSREGFLNLAQWAGLIRLQSDKQEKSVYGTFVFAPMQWDTEFTCPFLYCLGLGELALMEYAGKNGWFPPIQEASSSGTGRSNVYPDPYCVRLSNNYKRFPEVIARKPLYPSPIWIRCYVRSGIDVKYDDSFDA